MTEPRPLLPSSQPDRARAHDLIPGGAHTYAKGDDQWPATAPGFLVRGFGSRAWDTFGNEYVEYGQGLRAVTLGHGHPAIVRAVTNAVRNGTNFVRPHPLEVEAAERFLGFIGRPDWMVKFAKNGSDATTAAVKLARAATGRPLVGICRDHPFFSTDDWFIATTPMAAGIPKEVADLTRTFAYGDLDGLDELLRLEGDRLAAVILEAAKYDDPPPGWLDGLVERCRAHGVLVILDEMITGMRWPTGTAMGAYGITPDLAAFGKALGNGVSVAALTGRRELMEQGGLRTEEERVFLLSTTHGAETIGLAAALATIDVYEQEDVLGRMASVGRRLRTEVERAVHDEGLADHLTIHGLPAGLVWSAADEAGQPSQDLRTLVLQELVRRGVLAPSLVVGGAHTHGDIDRTAAAFSGAAQALGRALEDGVEHHLVGSPSAPVFRPRVAPWTMNTNRLGSS